MTEQPVCPVCQSELEDTIREDGWVFEGYCPTHGEITFKIEMPGVYRIPEK